MDIKIDNAVLCFGDHQTTAGDPIGPDNLRVRLQRGVDVYEYIGAAGIDSEHKGCDRKSISFGVTRTYGSEADAKAAILTVMALDMEGAVTVSSTAFMAKGNVLSLDVAQIGCSLICSYMIEGY